MGSGLNVCSPSVGEKDWARVGALNLGISDLDVGYDDKATQLD